MAKTGKASFVAIYFDGVKWTSSDVITVPEAFGEEERRITKSFPAEHNMGEDEVRFQTYEEGSDERIAKIVDEYNNDVEQGLAKTCRCKDCNKFWFLSKEEKEWFERKNLTLPKRCHHCRDIRTQKTKKL